MKPNKFDYDEALSASNIIRPLMKATTLPCGGIDSVLSKADTTLNELFTAFTCNSDPEEIYFTRDDLNSALLVAEKIKNKDEEFLAERKLWHKKQLKNLDNK